MKDCLIILGMGGPDSTATIPAFLYNLFSDREIINFHIGDRPQKVIAKVIAKKRGEKLIPSYLKMGMKNGASPQNFWTDKLIEKLPHIYKEKNGIELDCFAAMCYFTPYLEDTLKKVANGGYRKLILFTTYPQYSMTTTGALINRITKSEILHKSDAEKIVVINEWYKNKLYNEALVTRIKNAAAKLNKKIDECHILFTAHSIPLSYVAKGDTYPAKISEHVKLICEQAEIKNYEISYQSKVGPIKWLAPATKDRMYALKNERKDNLILLPISFISDHIETLIEIDDELLKEYTVDGLKAVRTESLNDSDDFLKTIVNIISE